jgi:hypothetical protein
MTTTYRPSAARDSQGRIQLWVTDTLKDGSNGACAHLLQAEPNGEAVSGFVEEPPVSARDDPTLIANQDGHLELFVTESANDELMHTWRDAAEDRWLGWDSLGDVDGNDAESTPAAELNADGRLEVFVADSGGKLWHRWQTQPNNGWSGWDSLDRPKRGNWFTRVSVDGDPSIVVNEFAQPAGRLEVFVQGTDSELWHIWQQTPNGSWSSWASLGAPSADLNDSPVVARNFDGRLEVFVQGGDDQLWHIWQQEGDPIWSDWARMPQLGDDTDSRPAVGMNGAQMGDFAPGRLEVFVTDDFSVLHHCWQVEPGGSWSDWSSFDRPSEDEGLMAPGVGQDENGALEVFAQSGTTGRVFRRRQRDGAAGGWTPWEDLGVP